MAAGRTQPIPTVSSGARAASLGGTRRDLGLDLARAFAVLSRTETETDRKKERDIS